MHSPAWRIRERKLSHDLDTTTGAPAIAYVGETPWHRFGERLEPNQPIDAWVKAAKLDWHLNMLPVKYEFDGETKLMPERYVLARSDSGQALSVVSNTYLVVQPKEVLEFYRDLVETRGYALETAGALDGGRKVWALAKTGLVANVSQNPEDQVGAYLLLATSCDKTLATTVSFTSVRVVCQNTLHFAFQDIKGESRRHIKVNHSNHFDQKGIKEELGLLDPAWDAFKAKLDQLAQSEVRSTDEARNFFVQLLTTPKERSTGNLSGAKQADLQQLMSCYQNSSPGRNLPTAKSTLWGVVNAVTHYVDHLKVVRGDRQDSAWFGTGAALKERAFDLALSMCLSTSCK